MGNKTILVIVFAALAFPQAAQREARNTMVKSQIAARGVKDPRVLEALRKTPRHEFVPSELQAHAYEDRPLPIGYGQTISQPYIVGLMTELLDTAPGHKVLEIGTGSGYQAAVLAGLVKHVYSIEIVPELAKSAQKTFDRLGIRNITVRQGDGYLGWPEEAPFDRIILTAAPPEIPRTLVDQLRHGGRMSAPEGERNQELLVIEKRLDGTVQRRAVIPVLFVPMVPGRQQ